MMCYLLLEKYVGVLLMMEEACSHLHPPSLMLHDGVRTHGTGEKKLLENWRKSKMKACTCFLDLSQLTKYTDFLKHKCVSLV